MNKARRWQIPHRPLRDRLSRFSEFVPCRDFLCGRQSSCRSSATSKMKAVLKGFFFARSSKAPGRLGPRRGVHRFGTKPRLAKLSGPLRGTARRNPPSTRGRRAWRFDPPRSHYRFSSSAEALRVQAATLVLDLTPISAVLDPFGQNTGWCCCATNIWRAKIAFSERTFRPQSAGRDQMRSQAGHDSRAVLP